jgi:hypothetical protein
MARPSEACPRSQGNDRNELEWSLLLRASPGKDGSGRSIGTAKEEGTVVCSAGPHRSESRCAFQPNVSAGFRSDPTNRTMPPNLDETGAIAWLPSQRGQR